jgi:hypothetical protein
VHLEISDFHDRETEIIEAEEAKAGINRVVWNLEFSTTQDDRETFKDHLSAVMDRLTEMVRKPEEKVKIDALRKRLNDVPTEDPPEKSEDEEGEEEEHPDDLLNEIRRDLVWDFSIYAGGKPFFGEKLKTREAPAGEYRVRLTLGNDTYEGNLIVREDPLVENGGK